MRPHVRTVSASLVVALLLSLVAAVPLPAAEPAPPPKEDQARKPAAPPAGPFEVRLNDGSTMKVTLCDERIELTTRYGTLLIPVADLRQIDVGRRVPEDVARRIDAAIANLGSKRFEDRQAAAAELVRLREKAYPAVVKALKSPDAEVARAAEDVLEKLKEEVPQEQLDVPAYDVVYTADSKITGHLTGAVLKVHTGPFGDQPLKLADVRGLRSGPAGTEMVKAEPGPENLTALANQVGKTFAFRITGTRDGTVWGTDVYTSDSSLATAAVHAGAIKAGQTGVVRVTIVVPPPMYEGSTRNGVTTQPWGFHPGAFRVQAVK
ncbi:MAG TPA: LCCL domain-containing protein [Gemmataceae bacterium]|nr:LCCL domain-containing protein [Gemmataceae bacterium]